MVAAPFKPTVEQPYIDATRPDLFGETGFGDVASAAFAKFPTWSVNALPGRDARGLLSAGNLRQREDLEARKTGDYRDTPSGPRPVLRPREEVFDSIDTLNERYKHLGLKFDRSMSPGAAEIIAQEKEQELQLQEVMSANPNAVSRFAGALAGGFVASLGDPVELATGIMPFISAANRAWLATRLGSRGAGVAAGAVEGALGNAVLEPGYYALSKQAYLDYTMADAVMNVGIGALLGGSIGAFRPVDVPTIPAPEAALDQMMRGKTVDVEALDPELAQLNRRKIETLRAEVEQSVFAARSPVDEALPRAERRRATRRARDEARAAGRLWASFFESAAYRWGTTVEQVRDILPELGTVRRATDAPEGALAQRAPNTPEFRHWFEGSKVLDEAGEPLRVYHGRKRDFDQFSSERSYYDDAHFFTPDPETAGHFAGDRGSDGQSPNIVPAFLSLKNPLVVDAGGEMLGGLDARHISEAKSAGHDGVIFRNYRERIRDQQGGFRDAVADQYVVFDPAQIKGAFNERPTGDPRFMRQSDRGYFDRATGAIGLFQAADASTFLHESAHLFLDIMGRLSELPDAAPALKADMAILYKELGVKSWRDLESPAPLSQPARAPIEVDPARIGIPEDANTRSKEIQSRVSHWYADNLRGTVVDVPGLGEVRFTDFGRSKIRDVAGAPMKWQVLPYVPDILRSGQLVGNVPVRSAKHKIDGKPLTAWHRVLAPVEIGGRRYNVSVEIAETSDGKFHYAPMIGRAESAGYARALPEGTGTTGSTRSRPDMNIAITARDDNARGMEGDPVSAREGGMIDDPFDGRSRDDGPDTLFQGGVGRDHPLEKFARGFEQYLRDGQAPVPALQRLFDMFRSWLTKIYRSAEDLDVEISPEVRGVMDRMLTAPEEIDVRTLARREVDPRRDRLADFNAADRITRMVDEAPDDEADMLAEFMDEVDAEIEEAIRDGRLDENSVGYREVVTNSAGEEVATQTQSLRDVVAEGAALRAKARSVGEVAEAMAVCFRGR